MNGMFEKMTAENNMDHHWMITKALLCTCEPHLIKLLKRWAYMLHTYSLSENGVIVIAKTVLASSCVYIWAVMSWSHKPETHSFTLIT